jgi:DNA-directed RNA polymerase specialized sigma24 family protein
MTDSDEFVTAHVDDLLRTAYLIVWDEGEAEDLVQECLLKVARRWPRTRRMEQPQAYARRILINLALDGARRRAQRRGELEHGASASLVAADPLPALEGRASGSALDGTHGWGRQPIAPRLLGVSSAAHPQGGR